MAGFSSLNEVLDEQYGNSAPRRSRFAVSADDTREDRIRKFIGRNGIMLVAVIIAILALIITTNVSHSRAKTLDEHKAEILSLQHDVDTNKKEYNTARERTVRQATGGVDSDHRADDEEVASRLFRDALTWDGIPEYMEARDKVKRAYKLDEGSQFMQVFMPGEMQGVSRKAPSGKTYYAADSDLKSHYEGMDTVVTQVNGDVYSYWAEVTARVDAKSGQTSEPMTIITTFDVVDGDITNIQAHTSPNGVEKTS